VISLIRWLDQLRARRELARELAYEMAHPADECGWCGDPFDPETSGDDGYCSPEHRAADDADAEAWFAAHPPSEGR
jgi:hypothetical protein